MTTTYQLVIAIEELDDGNPGPDFVDTWVLPTRYSDLADAIDAAVQLIRKRKEPSVSQQ